MLLELMEMFFSFDLLHHFIAKSYNQFEYELDKCICNLWRIIIFLSLDQLFVCSFFSFFISIIRIECSGFL